MFKIGRLAVLILAIVFVFAAGAFAQSKFIAAKSAYVYLEILDYIKNYSVYELSEDELAEFSECALGRAFVSIEIPKNEEIKQDIKLPSCFKQDKHARYQDPVDVKLMFQDMVGNFGGIGSEVRPAKDGQGVLVTDVMEGGPAAKSGLLKKDDVIVSAGESADKMRSFTGMSFSRMVGLIRGKLDTEVFLEVVRDGKKLEQFAIVRGEVKIITVEARKLDSGIGYMRVRTFKKEEMVKEDVLPALSKFNEQGVNKLIIDLRGNLGGLAVVAVEFAGLFVPDGNMSIVEFRGRKNKVEEKYLSEQKGRYADLQIAILVDKSSASASEIVSGAMQIWGAKLFGEKTYGKGSVQRVFPLSDGGVFSVTIQKYYLANNTTLDGAGIIPDFVIEKPKDGKKDKEDDKDKKDIVLEAAENYLLGLN